VRESNSDEKGGADQDLVAGGYRSKNAISVLWFFFNNWRRTLHGEELHGRLPFELLQILQQLTWTNGALSTFL
jgi:hypothetical protein